MKRATLAFFAAGFGLLNIRGGCGPGLPGPETTCLDTRAAPAMETVVLGAMKDGNFSAFMGDEALTPEFGPQGGQHVWVSIEYYAMGDAEWLHQFEIVRRGTEEKIGDRGTVQNACSPGWNRVEMINVFVDDGVEGDATIKLTSGPFTGEGQSRTIEATADVRIVR